MASALYKILVRDTFIVDNSTDGFCKHVSNTELLDLSATLRIGDGVGEDNLLEGRVLHTLAGRTAHHTV